MNICLKLGAMAVVLALAFAAGAAQAEGKLSIYHWFEYIPGQDH